MQGQLIFNVNLLLNFTLQGGGEWLVQRYSVDNMLNLLAVSPGDLVQWLVVLSSSWVALVPWGRPWGDSGERGREEKSEVVYGYTQGTSTPLEYIPQWGGRGIGTLTWSGVL